MRSDRRSFLTGMGALAATALSGSAFAQDAIQAILNAPRRGNWNEQFDARVSSGADVQTTVPIFSQETVFYVQQAIAQYQNIVAQGGWPVVPATKKLQLGVVDPDVEVLRRRLMISGDLAPQAGMSQAFDSYVDTAVKRFQARHGLPGDGVTGEYTFAAINVSAPIRLGQLQTNLERLSAKVSKPLGDRYVMVNIPAAEIEAVEGGRVALRNTAVVGKIDRQTPILSSVINEVIVNPYWNAPDSIVRRDIIPVIRDNLRYLTENNIRILGPNGEIDPATIDWSTDEAAKYRFRQDPGGPNVMGSVKVNFPNEHAVYLHDTPLQNLFTDVARFHSSGCVRVQNVRDLATWLLRDTDGWNRQRFEQTIKTGESVPVELAAPVPIQITYVSAWSTGDGVVHLRDDIYAMDGVRELQISAAI